MISSKSTDARLRPFVEALVTAVFDASAHTSSAVRRAIGEGDPEEPKLAAYVEKIRAASYRIASSDIDELRASGLDDDGIFEITVAAALGEGLRRLRSGLRALGIEP